MRFDDTLGTVLAGDLTTASSVQAAWRQLVDLIGRGRAPADDRAIATLERIRAAVPLAVRSTSARALFGARPPAPLVALLVRDDIAVAAPVLRSAALSAEDWIALLPTLSPTARAVLRHRRDLPHDAVRALASFGTVDFVLGTDGAAQVEAQAEPVPVAADPEIAVPPTIAADPGPFVSVGAIALGLPVVAEALRRENDNEAPPGDEGMFRIADVVARLEAFQRKRDAAPALVQAAPALATIEGFRFETDAAGAIRWVDGVARGALVGMQLAQPARPAEPGVDGIAAGAFRRRSRFSDAHLLVGGSGGAAGLWLISAVPAFDPASGRFTGYRGSARRLERHERPETTRAHGVTDPSDSLRQLVHELRTPTNAIAGFSEMIEHQMLGPVAEPYRAQATAMRSDAGGLLAAIDDLDAAARIDAGALQLRAEPVAIAPLLARIANDLAPLTRDRGATLAIDGGDGEGVILADARALERLVARTLGAMIGAAATGETIAVRHFAAAGDRIGLAVSRPIALDAHPGDAVLAIDDEDSPATLLGIGFALRLARNLVRELGGAMTFGQRSLTLYLPAAVDRTMGQARTN